MASTFLILLPIFALIFAGYICRQRGLLGESAASEINRFVVWLALPALLFDIMAHTAWEQIYQPAVFWTFTLANALVFVAVLTWRLIARKPLADASIDAIAASYPNTGYVGFPLLLLIFGKDSLMPTTMATIVVVCLLFAIAIALMEAALQKERHPVRLMSKVGSAVLRNPLIVAPVLGALWSAIGISIPASAETFLKLLGGAASPCALVGLGLFLANQRKSLPKAEKSAGKERRNVVTLLTLAKLVLQPAITWVLAARVFMLPVDLRNMVVLLAALPTGTGPFMLAEYYRRDAGLISTVILSATSASVLTLVGTMSLMGLSAL